MATFTPREAARATSWPLPKRGIVVAVYTSSQVEKFGTTLPTGVISVPVDRARKSGNRTAFFIVHRLRMHVGDCGCVDRHVRRTVYIKRYISRGRPVRGIAKLFNHGRSQAVRLPKEFRFEGKEVRSPRSATG